MARPKHSLGIAHKAKSLVVSMLAGQALAAFAAHTLKVRMPQTGKIIGVTLNVGLRGGAHVTSTIQVQNGATPLLVAAFDVAALTPGTPVDKEGAALAAAADSVAIDSEIRVVLTEAGGTAPTFADATLQIDYLPLGD